MEHCRFQAARAAAAAERLTQATSAAVVAAGEAYRPSPQERLLSATSKSLAVTAARPVPVLRVQRQAGQPATEAWLEAMMGVTVMAEAEEAAATPCWTQAINQ